MSEDRGKGTGPAFPELELDMPARPASAATHQESEDDEHHELAIELDAPVSLKQAAFAAPSLPPNSGPVSARGPVSMGPPVSARSVVPMGPPSCAPPSGTTVPVSMGPPPALAQTFTSVGPPPISGSATQAPPSGAAAFVQRAKEAAKEAADDPGAVARNVAEVGNRTSSALVMLGGAILLTLIDVVYSRITGERFSIGGLRLVWIAAPLALIGGIVIGVRLLKEHAQ
jgi:hypothetical protein